MDSVNNTSTPTETQPTTSTTPATPGQPTVTIYSTATCHFCHMAKDFFAAHNVAFTDHNVGTDLEARKVMVDKTQQMGVPVITVTRPPVTEGMPPQEEIIIGFDEERLRELLNIK